MRLLNIIASLLVSIPLAACSHDEPGQGIVNEEVEKIEYNTAVRRTTAGLPATDELGRKLPGYDEVGPEKEGKFVGLFYWIWHSHFAKSVPCAFNVSAAVAQYPEAADDYNHPVWGGVRLGTYWWGEPLFGYYRETDQWVVARHAEMLCEAGVDVIIFDCTNGTETWDEGWQSLCATFTRCRKNGMRTPQIAFMLPFTGGNDTRTSLKHLYSEIYGRGLYKDLWFYWKGKPLVIAHADGVTGPEAEFFTFRENIGVYNCSSQSVLNKSWGWLEIAPQHGWYATASGYEEATVGVAQNWTAERGLTAMNAPGAFGRSYTHAGGHNSDPDAVNRGLNFQEQWDRALEIDPEFIFITGWNEWNMGRYDMWQSQVNAFPDEFNQEYSRDIEPMKGGHGDNYYWQMAANIRRFKGTSPEAAPCPAATDPDGWKDVNKVNSGFWGKAAAFDTFKGNASRRNAEGWGGEVLQNKNASLDILGARVAHDGENVYFFLNFNTLFANSTSKLRLFLDTDRNHETGWEGYDYMVDMTSGFKSCSVMKNADNHWRWTDCDTVVTASRTDVVTLKVPRSLIGLPAGPVSFEFKWTDSLQGTGKVDELWTDGDVAPTGRYNYLYKGL